MAKPVPDAAPAPAQVVARALPAAHPCQDTAVPERPFVVPWRLRARLGLEMPVFQVGLRLLRLSVNVRRHRELGAS
jgi:hypothetical protein